MIRKASPCGVEWQAGIPITFRKSLGYRDLVCVRPGQRGRSRSGERGAGRQVPSRILQRYDKDGDGKLNEEEQDAFEKARQQRGRGAAGTTISYHSRG